MSRGDSCCSSDSSKSSDDECSCLKIDRKAEKRKKKKDKKKKKEIDVCAKPCRCCECTSCRDCGCVEDQKKPCGSLCTCCQCSPSDNIYCGCPNKDKDGTFKSVDTGNFGQKISRVLGIDKLRASTPKVISCDCGEEGCPRTGCPKPVKPYVEVIPEEDKKKGKKKAEAPKCDKECQEKKTCMPFCKIKEPEREKTSDVILLYSATDESDRGESGSSDEKNTNRSAEKVHFPNSQSSEGDGRNHKSNMRSENGTNEQSNHTQSRTLNENGEKLENKDKLGNKDKLENNHVQKDNTRKCPMCLTCDYTGDSDGTRNKSKKQELKKCPAFNPESTKESVKRANNKIDCLCSKQNNKVSDQKIKTPEFTCHCQPQKHEEAKISEKKNISKSNCVCKPNGQDMEAEPREYNTSEYDSESPADNETVKTLFCQQKGELNRQENHHNNSSRQNNRYREEQHQNKKTENGEFTYIECPVFDQKRAKVTERFQFDNCGCKSMNEDGSSKVNQKERSPNMCMCNKNRAKQENDQNEESLNAPCACKPNEGQLGNDEAQVQTKYCPVFDGPKTCPMLKKIKATLLDKKDNGKKDKEIKQNDSLESIYICTYRMMKGIDKDTESS